VRIVGRAAFMFDFAGQARAVGDEIDQADLAPV
jgi:hypothetical protein